MVNTAMAKVTFWGRRSGVSSLPSLPHPYPVLSPVLTSCKFIAMGPNHTALDLPHPDL